MKSVKKLVTGKDAGKWAVVDKDQTNPATKLPGLVVAIFDTRSAAREAK